MKRTPRCAQSCGGGLAFDPGQFVPAFPYVEPFVKDADTAWRRKVHYLVAGLWGRALEGGATGAFAATRPGMCGVSILQAGSTSVERRFITLLDADTDQLTHRLRQMVALLKDQSIDFESVLKGLLFWNDDQKRTQNAWARDYYRTQSDTIFERYIQRGGRRMKTIVEIHALQNFAPSNLNRDDTGAPKDALFGGTRRARVSSQCFKRGGAAALWRIG